VLSCIPQEVLLFIFSLCEFKLGESYEEALLINDPSDVAFNVLEI